MFSRALLTEMIEKGYVQVQSHPEGNLFIYNYTAKAQYEKMWNEVTLACRGLIMNKEGELHARPFAKFFNLEETDKPIPSETFEVYEKLDGSLGILYWQNDTPHIATRGSFTSEQAQEGTRILHEKYASVFPLLNKDHTYLFEIIYPENRIVVNYGEQRDLVLLATIHKETGEDLPLPDIGFPLVKKYDGVKDIFELKGMTEENKEGFVIRFKNGYRLKVKFEEYVRIHKMVTGVSSLTIWEHLQSGQPMDELLERVPDEFYRWVKHTVFELETAYKKIEDICRLEFKTFDDRKTAAEYYQTKMYPSILFRMLDNKPYADIIWKKIRPAFARPYQQNTD